MGTHRWGPLWRLETHPRGQGQGFLHLLAPALCWEIAGSGTKPVKRADVGSASVELTATNLGGSSLPKFEPFVVVA